MKKTLLTVALLGSVAAFAQRSPVQVPGSVNKKAKPVESQDMSFSDMAAAASAQRNQSNPPSTLATETVVGETTYPLQTNRSTMNRCMRNSDGTISVSYTTSNGAWNSWPDRGTGYNYFDGTSWQISPSGPFPRIENDRTGFGEVHVVGAGELSCAHNTNQGNAQHLCSRPAKGTGTWNQTFTAIPDPGGFFTYGQLWPRMAVGGANGNTVHHIALTTPTTATPAGAPYRGQDGALVYARSTDGGTTWSNPDVISLIDSSNYVSWGGDAYAIDARGTTVAIVVGDLTSDVVLLKSTDDGMTWTKTIVKQFPIPMYSGGITDINGDQIADTIPSCDQSMDVLIDNNGQCHVWYGYMETINPDGSPDSVYYFPGMNGLMYWNEGMGANNPTTIAGALDYNGNGGLDLTANGWGSYYTSLSSHPSAGIDAAGNLFCAYDAIVENTDNGSGKAYRNVYVIASADGGTTWSAPYDHLSLDPNNFDFYERAYPSMGRNVINNMVGMIYQRDAQPGHGVGTNNPDASENQGGINQIVYVEFLASDVIGIHENNNPVSNLSLYPNPAADNIILTVGISQADVYNVQISNMIGQNLISSSQRMNTGNNRVDLNTASLAPGVYFVTVSNGSNKLTAKLVKE